MCLYLSKLDIKTYARIFDFVFNKIGHDKRAHAMIVGDSITSDILGGKNAAIKHVGLIQEIK